MKIPTRARPRGLRFNLTSMIDIVFLLIIFFLVASHFNSRETQQEIGGLPKVHAEPVKIKPGPKIVISIDEEQRFFVESQEIGMAEIAERIRAGGARHGDRFAVYLRLNADTRHEVYEPIIKACGAAKVKKVFYAIVEE